MDTLRCPTCLTVLLESTAKRCPSCHSRLRNRRGQPIVLGETSSLDGHWNLEQPAPMPQTLRPAWIHLTPPAPEPVPWFDEPEPDASADAAPPRRSLRLMAPPSSNRRRWSVEFSRHGDDV
jgi:hypothetical protein